MKMSIVSVHMPIEVRLKLEKLASEQHRSLSSQITHYLMHTLRELEE